MQKYKQVKVNFLPEDHARIFEMATSSNQTIAQLIRERFSVEIENAPSRKPVYKRVDPQLLFQLNKIGNNLNQIAKKLNTSGEFERGMILKIYNEVMGLK